MPCLVRLVLVNVDRKKRGATRSKFAYLDRCTDIALISETIAQINFSPPSQTLALFVRHSILNLRAAHVESRTTLQGSPLYLRPMQCCTFVTDVAALILL